MSESASKAIDVAVGAIDNAVDAGKIASTSAVETPAEVAEIVSGALSGGTEVVVKTKDEGIELLRDKMHDIADAIKKLLGG